MTGFAMTHLLESPGRTHVVGAGFDGATVTPRTDGYSAGRATAAQPVLADSFDGTPKGGADRAGVAEPALTR